MHHTSTLQINPSHRNGFLTYHPIAFAIPRPIESVVFTIEVPIADTTGIQSGAAKTTSTPPMMIGVPKPHHRKI